MEERNKKNLIRTMVLFAIFIIFTMAVGIISVSAIGPQGSSVGFSRINGGFAAKHPFNELWYDITKYLGYLAILICIFFAASGIIQAVSTRSIKKVSPHLIVLGVFYVAVIAFYVMFNKIIVNYRPVLEDGSLESSYPSSHAMLAICVFVSAIVQISLGNGTDKFKTLSTVVLGVLTVIMIVGRLLSGVHWFTDIIGGIILSAALLMAYYTAICSLKDQDFENILS